MRGFPREVRGVVEKVEAVFELRIDLHGFDAGKRGLLEAQTLRFAVHGRGVNVVRVVEVFGFAVEDARVFDAHFVHVVGVKSEDGHAAVRKQHATAHVVRNRDPAGLREHRHFGLFDHVAAVTDDGRQGRDLVRIHDDFAQVPLRFVGRFRPGGASHGESGERQGGADRGNGERGTVQMRHRDSPFFRMPGSRRKSDSAKSMNGQSEKRTNPVEPTGRKTPGNYEEARVNPSVRHAFSQQPEW